MGTTTVKWTTLDSCLVLSESDGILYTNFEFCEDKIDQRFIEDLQSQAMYGDKCF